MITAKRKDRFFERKKDEVRRRHFVLNLETTWLKIFSKKSLKKTAPPKSTERIDWSEMMDKKQKNTEKKIFKNRGNFKKSKTKKAYYAYAWVNFFSAKWKKKCLWYG